ncbi:hypothetical protein D9757_012134 [Collybiopsis confluens]|uniref:Uncharacterized protein n=1 Tax=Collybiopsis confluens TaxID=2823264 RepID=A0A8H5GHU9_9AGAR|nr:hypothetical protein D9757_012134 [Collybiopsis confluens]
MSSTSDAIDHVVPGSETGTDDTIDNSSDIDFVEEARRLAEQRLNEADAVTASARFFLDNVIEVPLNDPYVSLRERRQTTFDIQGLYVSDARGQPLTFQIVGEIANAPSINAVGPYFSTMKPYGDQLPDLEALRKNVATLAIVPISTSPDCPKQFHFIYKKLKDNFDEVTAFGRDIIANFQTANKNKDTDLYGENFEIDFPTWDVDINDVWGLVVKSRRLFSDVPKGGKTQVIKRPPGADKKLTPRQLNEKIKDDRLLDFKSKAHIDAYLAHLPDPNAYYITLAANYDLSKVTIQTPEWRNEENNIVPVTQYWSVFQPGTKVVVDIMLHVYDITERNGKRIERPGRKPNVIAKRLRVLPTDDDFVTAMYIHRGYEQKAADNHDKEETRLAQISRTENLAREKKRVADELTRGVDTDKRAKLTDTNSSSIPSSSTNHLTPASATHTRPVGSSVSMPHSPPESTQSGDGAVIVEASTSVPTSSKNMFQFLWM